MARNERTSARIASMAARVWNRIQRGGKATDEEVLSFCGSLMTQALDKRLASRSRKARKSARKAKAGK